MGPPQAKRSLREAIGEYQFLTGGAFHFRIGASPLKVGASRKAGLEVRG